MNDVSLAWRHLRKAPTFTAAAVFSIALGIGANTAVFTLVNEFLLRPLPVKNPDELVMFRAIHGVKGRMSRRGEGPGTVDPVTGRNSGTPLSLLMFERFRSQQSGLSDVFAFAPFSQVHVLIGDVPETAVSAQFVSGNYYAGLGVQERLGRLITSADDRTSAPPVAVISHRFWESRFGADPGALGANIVINRVPTTVIGVSPPRFDGAMQAGETADISVALALHARFQPDRIERAQPWYWWVRIMGRVAPGSTAAQAQAMLEPVFQQAARESWITGDAVEPRGAMPDLPTLAVDSGAQGENDVRRYYAGSLKILMGLVGLVLAAACVNVANLLVARSNARRREIAVRLAVGARRGHIVRQLLVESMMLAFGGAALGVVLAWWSRGLLLALRPFGNTAVALDLPLDGRVLGFTLAIAVTTALVAGLAPALRTARLDLTSEFQGGTRSVSGSQRLNQTFMVIQVALSLVLLVNTGLFVRTVNHLEAIDAGFNRSNLTLFRIDATSAGYTPETSARLHARIQERLEAVPGVRAATFSRVPLLSRVRQNMTFSLPGHTPPPGAPMVANTNGLAVNFFRAMELPLLLGRGFVEQDDEDSPRVAVVNHTFARTYFGAENPVGQQLAFSAPNFRHQVEIVGVARDAKYTDLRGATPATVYFPALQQLDGSANFAVRTSSDASMMLAAIQGAVRGIDPALPVLNLRTQTEQIDRLHGQERLFARLSGFFGLATLALACVGIYGLLSHAVLSRSGEIGIRMALGARPGWMLGMVVRESVILAAFGVALGAMAAYGSGRLVAAMLFGVSSNDPLTYGAVVLILVGAAVLASLLPAWRASRVNPLEALRAQ